jgi:predicted molibdopterin-dependent oxidoreductase YjgC
MFNRHDETRATWRMSFDGQPIEAKSGETVAAALLAAGIVDFRDSAASGAARGPWCLMGVCFDCLVEIDGVANRQACLVPAADGMAVRRMRGARP